MLGSKIRVQADATAKPGGGIVRFMEKLTKPVLKTVSTIFVLLAVIVGARFLEEENLERLLGPYGHRILGLWNEPLVKVGGQAVRWVPGEGWVEDRA